jgi:hypothetical protein
MKTPLIYGLMAEFETPTELVRAAERAHTAGYTYMDAYSPFPIEEVSEALGQHKTWVPLITLFGGLLGATIGFSFQEYIAAINFPNVVAGRPLNSWPSFVIVTFELTILTASLFSAIGMLALNGLPKPYHPVFNVKQFARATTDRFFLVIEARDPKFDASGTSEFLESLKPRSLAEVPN